MHQHKNIQKKQLQTKYKIKKQILQYHIAIYMYIHEKDSKPIQTHPKRYHKHTNKQINKLSIQSI